MKRIIPLVLACTLLLASCHRSNVVYNETHTFAGNVWNHFTAEQFDIDISNVEDYYNIDFVAEVDTALFRYDRLTLRVEMSNPAGEQRQWYYTLPLKENGRWRGQVHDGYRAVQGRARSYFTFNHRGSHQMEVFQMAGPYDLEGVHSIAVKVEKTKLDYSM